MSNPDEKPLYTDPEIEALLVGLPQDLQQQFRKSIDGVRSILTSEEWEKMRISYINDIKTQHEKKQLMEKMTEVKEKLNEIQEGMDEIAELERKMDEITELEELMKEKMDEIRKGMDKIQKDLQELINLNKKLDSFKNK